MADIADEIVLRFLKMDPNVPEENDIIHITQRNYRNYVIGGAVTMVAGIIRIAVTIVPDHDVAHTICFTLGGCGIFFGRCIMIPFICFHGKIVLFYDDNGSNVIVRKYVFLLQFQT